MMKAILRPVSDSTFLEIFFPASLSDNLGIGDVSLQRSSGYVLIKRIEGSGMILYSILWFLDKEIQETVILEQADGLVKDFIDLPGDITHQIIYTSKGKTFEGNEMMRA